MNISQPVAPSYHPKADAESFHQGGHPCQSPPEHAPETEVWVVLPFEAGSSEFSL